MSELAAASLIEEFFAGPFNPDELGERWIGVIRPLQENPVKDADRAGEHLLVFSNASAGNEQEWVFHIQIVGRESGVEYAEIHFVWHGDAMRVEKLVELELHFKASLAAALNGPERFSQEEKDALAEALGAGGIACDHCHKRFAFFQEALEHEQGCAGSLRAAE